MERNIIKHLKHQEELKRLTEKSFDLEQNNNDKNNKIKRKYWDLERDLKTKQYAEEKETQEKFESELSKIKEKNKSNVEAMKEFNYILNLYDLKNEKINLKDFGVYAYDYNTKENGEKDYSKDKEKQYYKEIDTLENNEYLNLRVFMVDNDKPKNKYSLVVIGNSLFVNNNTRMPIFKEHIYSYGLSCHTDNTNIRTPIKDFSTKEEALKYCEKHKDKFLKEFRQEHEKVIKDFKEIVKECNTNEWEIESLKRKKYYYENNYSQGTETKEYKQIIKKLKTLGGL